MKLACEFGRRVERVEGHRDVASTALGAAKFTERCLAALSGAGANLSRRSWEQPAAGVDVYTFGHWQLARRIFCGYIPTISTKNGPSQRVRH